MKKRTASRIAALVAIGTGAFLTAAAIITKTRKQSSIDSLAEHTDNPTLDYDAAIARYAEVQAEDDDTINLVCRSKIMTHGAKTERVIVLVHGIPTAQNSSLISPPCFLSKGIMS